MFVKEYISPEIAALPDNTQMQIMEKKKVPESLKERPTVHSFPMPSEIRDRVSQKFSVVTYNVMAECYSSPSEYPYTDPKYLSMDYRHGVLFSELVFLDADIFCLQEVETKYFWEILEPEMSGLGFKGVFVKRTFQDTKDGCCTFYRTSRFSPLETEIYYHGDEMLEHLQFPPEQKSKYTDVCSVLLVLTLKCRITGQAVTVANTHLTWKKDYPDVRCLQAAICTDVLTDCCRRHGSSYILCGDLNSSPRSPAYNLIVNGELTEEDMKNLQIEIGSEQILSFREVIKNLESERLPLTSSYHYILNRDPVATFIVGSEERCHDYVLFGNKNRKDNGNMVPVSVLEFLSPEKVREALPPSSVYPSGHMPLKVDFLFY